MNNNLAPIGSSVISAYSLADRFQQRARNVPLASADVRGGERLCDEPKEVLGRRVLARGARSLEENQKAITRLIGFRSS